MPSVTSSRSVRASSESMTRSAPRYILRFTIWAKSRGLAAKVLPPPTQIGERLDPARACPVPFCAQGLRPPPRTSARDFCALVPARPAARYAVTTWWMSAGLCSCPNAASDTCSSEEPLTVLSFIAVGSASLLGGRGLGGRLRASRGRLGGCSAGLHRCCRLGRRDG